MSEEEKCTCGCGHDHDKDDECCEEVMDTMTLTLDDDTELECSIIGVFEVDGQEYIALLPKDDDTVLIYEYYEEGDDVRLELIEDDDVFEKVSKTFNDLFDEDSDDEE